MRPPSLAKQNASAALTQPTPAQLGTVMDGLEHTWSENSLLIQQRLYHAIQRDDHNAASKWALAGAISTDKLLVLKGRPTEIIGHLHAHRHDHGAIMDKLARALGVGKEPAALPARPSIVPPTSPSTLVNAPSNVQVADIIGNG